MPKVSIILPIYNVEKYLKKCLDSVVNQTYKNIEIIAINDASPDKSLEIIKEYQNSYKNIKVINNSINLGLSASRNIGMQYAEGDYIFFLDSDDWISLNAIETLVSLAKNYKSPLVQCGYTSVWGSIKRRKSPSIPTVTYKDIEQNKDLLNKCGGVWNKLYQHNIVEGFSFPEGLWYEDNAFIYPLLTKVKSLVATNEILYYYKRHLNSITLSTKIYPNEKIFDKYKIVEFIKEKCQELGTFDDYQKQIDKITRTKILSTLFECTTWFQIPAYERSYLINSIYTYLKNTYNINSFSELIEGINLDKLDRFRLPLLLRSLDYDKVITTDEPLEEAKRIISKYKR